MIQATPISLTSRGNDRIAWIGNLRGIFDLKSAYSIAMGTDFTLPVNASWIWKFETLPRIKTLLWRCTHNNIGVKTCLAKRGIVDEDWCPIYQRDSETILHALRDCPRVKEVWIQSGVKVMNRVFWMSNLQEWLDINGKVNSSYIQGKPHWRIIFSFVAWNIWKSKNLYVFNKKNQNPYLSTEIENLTLEFMYYVTSPRNPICKTNRRIRWQKPPARWEKLNTDGSSMDSLERAGWRGIVRDEHGGWVVGFAKHIGSTKKFVAELWGLRDRLVLCCNMNISCLIVEIDANLAR